MLIEPPTHEHKYPRKFRRSQIATRQVFCFNEYAFDEIATAMYIPIDGFDDFCMTRYSHRNERGTAGGPKRDLSARLTRSGEPTTGLLSSGTTNRRQNLYAGCYPESVNP